MRTSFIPALAVMAFSVAVLTACSGTVPQPTPTATPSPSFPVTGDGILRIGSLFAASGPLAGYSSAQVAAIETAVREINEAGGYRGNPVEVFHRSAGDSDGNLAASGFDDLVERGVDVVIGPAIPGVAESLAPAAIAANVAIFDTAVHQERAVEPGLVVHVVTPESAQLAALFSGIAESGATSVAVVHSGEDAAGASLAKRAHGFAAAVEIDLSFDGVLDPESLQSVVAAVRAADAIIIATNAVDPDATAAFLTALAEEGVSADSLWFSSSALADYSALLPIVQLDGAHGTSASTVLDEEFVARLRQADPAVGNTVFAARAYDATILAVLSAVVGEDDGGPALARNVTEVTNSGIPCTSYGACLSVLATEPLMSYAGRTGPLAITAGAATRGKISPVVFDEANSYSLVSNPLEN